LRKAGAESYIRLVTKETTETKSRLLNNLANLSVWGVQEISLTQEVDDVKVTEDTGKIIFDDDDVCKLDIYISIKHSQEVKVDFELSKEFIRYCDITDPNFQKLVLPILQYPREDIENLLEEYGLYGIGDHDEQATELVESVSEESNDGSPPTPRVDSSTIFSPGTPDSGTDLLAQESSSQVSMPSSILRDRIPALDQSIASIQATAALPSTTPTLIITPSKIRTGSRSSSDNKYCEVQGAHQSRADNESPSPGNGMGEAGDSDSSTNYSGTETPYDAFEFRRFHSEFAEEFGLDSPSRGPRTSSTQHHSVPRYRRSPRYSGSSSSARAEPDPERTMQGFQNQKIGLLGETFVSNASHSFICLAETSCSQPKGQWVAFASSEKGLGSYPSLDKSKSKSSISPISIQGSRKRYYRFHIPRRQWGSYQAAGKIWISPRCPKLVQQPANLPSRSEIYFRELYRAFLYE
jgi:hypothetical protein